MYIYIYIYIFGCRQIKLNLTGPSLIYFSRSHQLQYLAVSCYIWLALSSYIYLYLTNSNCVPVISDVVEHHKIWQNIAFSGYVQQRLAVSGYTQLECLKELITTRHSSLSRYIKVFSRRSYIQEDIVRYSSIS